MSAFGERKNAFKTPPAVVARTSASQAARRDRALEAQKRRRAERIDSARSLDILADLTLGHSDDDAGDDGGPSGGPEVVRQGIGHFASMLPPAAAPSSDSATGITNFWPRAPVAAAASPAAEELQSDAQMLAASSLPTTFEGKASEKKRAKGKRKGKARASTATDAPQAQGQAAAKPRKPTKPNKWADKCMYAELLEMDESLGGIGGDGIPDDIETAFVALAPVPVGKRCLAVTHQASGVAGVVPNTTLRSRVLGKALMKPFPSSLPPQTVLDCILDDNWRDNGILHVLDVVSWKGQDLADCETPFRFWWRDTRLSEIASFPPPQSSALTTAKRYQFPHPTTFAPVPYDTDTTLAHLLAAVIPAARAARGAFFSRPIPPTPAAADAMESDMVLDAAPVQLQQARAEARSDGLLLYVAQAVYEPGTSPLSVWVPLRAYRTREEQEGMSVDATAADSPLDGFERLVRRRLAKKEGQGTPEVEMV
ncbi:uncharacterized protein BXZ73DRAFT_75239 [Epithele typhae]|uniref:uncharacterized protein n=1 Tax=Epithele typhae TaxID=378194 RepID=UPI0020082A25|nr:uncharacterized protein BXZ73DRAFT_75239 [Epithele typhae]KAH9941286.1 hypothetical protein BXZ73DRAFT_75239 [Epithele typhae]